MSEMSVQQKIGLRIRALREARGLRQNGFAYSAGISRDHLRRIEAGATNASIGTIERIADGLGVPLATFFNDDEFKCLGPNAGKIAYDSPLSEDAGKIAGAIGVRRNDEVVLAQLRSNPETTIASIVTKTQLSRSVVESTLKRLREKGRIRRVGSKKTGRWEVVARETGADAEGVPHS